MVADENAPPQTTASTLHGMKQRFISPENPRYRSTKWPPLGEGSTTTAIFDVRVLGVELTDARWYVGADVQWYNVRLVCRLRPDLSWQVTKRYSDFDALAQRLALDVGSPASPKLPPKLPVILLSPARLQRRVLGLQRFCQQVLAQPCLVSHRHVAAFFDLDFGLWHITCRMPPPVLDSSQQHAVRVLQCRTRTFLRARQQMYRRRALRTIELHVRAWHQRRTAHFNFPALEQDHRDSHSDCRLVPTYEWGMVWL
jgi:hypothetical protein